MKNAGVSYSDEPLRRRARPAIAASALMLLAIFPLTSPRAEDDAPVTAADVSRMTPLGGSAGAVASPAASATTADVAAPAPAAPMAESLPVAAAPEAAAVPLTAPPPPTAPVEADSINEPMRPTYTTPSVPPMDNPGDDWVAVTPPATQEIPQAIPPATTDDAPVAMVPPGTVPQSNDVSSYISSSDPDLGMGVGTARDFVAEGEETSPIGLEMRESRCKLKTGENAEGLLILKVEKDSAAAKAGLRPYKRAGHNVLEGLAIGAAMVFPPAILALPVIDYTEVGQSYDMIIGVDGSRVSNFVDFEERMRNLQPGELVYFSIVRNGKRIQIPVPVQPLNTSASTEKLP